MMLFHQKAGLVLSFVMLTAVAAQCLCLLTVVAEW